MQVNGDACGSKPSRGLAGRIEVQRARGFGCGDRVYRAADEAATREVQLGPKSTEFG